MTNKFTKPRSFLGNIKNIFKNGNVKEYIDDIEETLIEADIDLSIVDEMIEELKSEKLSSFDEACDFLREEFKIRLNSDIEKTKEKSGMHVILMTGINGAGKTTATAKLANMYKNEGKKVMLIAADTFRAAAIEQLVEWGNRLDIEVVKGMENADPASVVYDGVAKAKASEVDVLIIDTAGRLHTKVNLMQELTKIKKIVVKDIDEENIDTFIILDANTGKNAFVQAKEFDDALKLTGIILTKFDSSAKGGCIIHIRSELNLPIKYLTFGEQVEQIEEFNSDRFLEEMFS